MAEYVYDAYWRRHTLKHDEIKPRISGQKYRGGFIKHGSRSNMIEIMPGRLKNRQNVATRHDIYTNVFPSVVANVMFEL